MGNNFQKRQLSRFGHGSTVGHGFSISFLIFLILSINHNVKTMDTMSNYVHWGVYSNLEYPLPCNSA